jgi:hypothetical protein
VAEEDHGLAACEPAPVRRKVGGVRASTPASTSAELDLDTVPDRVEDVLGQPAQEGTLKVREASYVAAEGLLAERFFHGPSVALEA